MSDKSHIEWTEATWNPVTGCTKVSQGCKNCYAERDWKRLSANPTARAYYGRKFTNVQCHPERLDQPLRWRKPRRIFVNSMSDLFHEDVPVEFIDQVFAVMALAPQHTFQVLTKRPERMRDYLGALVDENERWERLGDAAGPIVGNAGYDAAYAGWPLPNVWPGVSIEDQPTADARIGPLLETPAAVRWISAEPLLGPVDLTGYLAANPDGMTLATGAAAIECRHGYDCCPICDGDPPATLDWVVAGGESGPRARPMHPDWSRSLRDQCVSARVPFFFKQWGEWAPGTFGCEGPHVVVQGTWEMVWPDGSTGSGSADANGGYGADMFRVGKRAAGRQLDGRTWDEVPA